VRFERETTIAPSCKEFGMPKKVEAKLGGRTLTIESGRIAKQAGGSVVVRYGDSVVLVTAQAKDEPAVGRDFLPLTVDYVEKTFAAGKIPGGFFKREGRPRRARRSPRASSTGRSARSSPTGTSMRRRWSPPCSPPTTITIRTSWA
jgi:hypothetical protein